MLYGYCPTEQVFRSSELVTPSLAYSCAYGRLAEQSPGGRPSLGQHDSGMEKTRAQGGEPSASESMPFAVPGIQNPGIRYKRPSIVGKCKRDFCRPNGLTFARPKQPDQPQAHV